MKTVHPLDFYIKAKVCLGKAKVLFLFFSRYGNVPVTSPERYGNVVTLPYVSPRYPT